MWKWLLLIPFLATASLASQVQITSPLPLPVTGTFTVSPSTSPSTFSFSIPTVTILSSTTINTSTTGNNTLVTGSGSTTVRVFRMFFIVSAATNIQFFDGTNPLTGVMTFNAGGAYIIDLEGDPWFVTSPGNGFVLNQSGTAQISGRVYWTQS